MLRVRANNHLRCQCLLFLTPPACTSPQCLLYTDRRPAHSVQPVLSIIQQQRAPLLAYVSGGDLLHMRQYSKVKRKETYHQRCNRNNKTRVSYSNRGLARRVCKDTLFLRLEQLWATFTYLSLLQCLFWGIQQLKKCRIKFLLSVPCCILLHLAAPCCTLLQPRPFGALISVHQARQHNCNCAYFAQSATC